MGFRVVRSFNLGDPLRDASFGGQAVHFRASSPILIRDQGDLFLQGPIDLLAGKHTVPPSFPKGPDCGVFAPDFAALGVGTGEPVGRCGGGPERKVERVLTELDEVRIFLNQPPHQSFGGVVRGGFVGGFVGGDADGGGDGIADGESGEGDAIGGIGDQRGLGGSEGGVGIGVGNEDVVGGAGGGGDGVAGGGGMTSGVGETAATPEVSN